MTSRKHTPGPWIAPKSQVNMVFQEVDWDSGLVGSIALGLQVRVSLQQGEDRAAADARLIAASPELLAACFAAKDALEDIGGWNNNVHKALKLIQAAIVKATGDEYE